MGNFEISQFPPCCGEVRSGPDQKIYSSKNRWGKALLSQGSLDQLSFRQKQCVKPMGIPPLGRSPPSRWVKIWPGGRVARRCSGCQCRMFSSHCFCFAAAKRRTRGTSAGCTIPYLVASILSLNTRQEI